MKTLIVRRRRSGTAIVELVVGLPLLVLVVCFGLQIMLVLMQTRMLDLAARDAARAAAMASSREEALKLARAAVSAHSIYGVAPDVSDSDITYKDNNGVAVPNSGPGPFVAVTVSCKLCLPCAGNAFLGCGDGQTAKRGYTFPLLRLSVDNEAPQA